MSVCVCTNHRSVHDVLFLKYLELLIEIHQLFETHLLTRQNESYKNLEFFFGLVLNRDCAMVVHTLANKLLPPLLIDKCETLSSI